MPAITKAQGKAALQHILMEILEDIEDDGTSGPIGLALLKHGVTGILGLNTISISDIPSLDYERTELDGTTKTLVDLRKGDIGVLNSFRAFIFQKDVRGDIVNTHEKSMCIDLEAFQTFRSSKEWFTLSANPVQAYAPAGGNSKGKDLVWEFKKGI